MNSNDYRKFAIKQLEEARARKRRGHMNGMTDESLMPFGTLKGTKMKDVPAGYLDYIYGMNWIDSWPRVKKYIEDNRNAIDQELEADQSAQEGWPY